MDHGYTKREIENIRSKWILKHCSQNHFEPLFLANSQQAMTTRKSKKDMRNMDSRVETESEGLVRVPLKILSISTTKITADRAFR